MTLAVREHDWDECRSLRSAENVDLRKATNQRGEPAEVVGVRVRQNNCVDVLDAVDVGRNLIEIISPNLDSAVDEDRVVAELQEVRAATDLVCAANRRQLQARR